MASLFVDPETAYALEVRAASVTALPPHVTERLRVLGVLGFPNEQIALQCLNDACGDLWNAVDLLMKKEREEWWEEEEFWNGPHEAELEEPEEPHGIIGKWDRQLRVLWELGFGDEHTALQCLEASGGELGAVADMLISKRAADDQQAIAASQKLAEDAAAASLFAEERSSQSPVQSPSATPSVTPSDPFALEMASMMANEETRAAIEEERLAIEKAVRDREEAEAAAAEAAAEADAAAVDAAAAEASSALATRQKAAADKTAKNQAAAAAAKKAAAAQLAQGEARKLVRAASAANTAALGAQTAARKVAAALTV